MGAGGSAARFQISGKALVDAFPAAVLGILCPRPGAGLRVLLGYPGCPPSWRYVPPADGANRKRFLDIGIWRGLAVFFGIHSVVVFKPIAPGNNRYYRSAGGRSALRGALAAAMGDRLFWAGIPALRF